MLGPARKVYPVNALIDDHTKPLFPASRHRSKRIRKKLLKRFGGEFGKKMVIMHLSERIVEALKAMDKL